QEPASAAVWLLLEARAAGLERLRSDQRNGNAVRQEPAEASGPNRNRVRNAARAQNLPARDPAWLPAAAAINKLDGRIRILHRAVSRLPLEQRKALDLAVFGGRNEAEIASELGEPLGKVQRSLRAAITFVKHRHRAVNGTWSANL